MNEVSADISREYPGLREQTVGADAKFAVHSADALRGVRLDLETERFSSGGSGGAVLPGARRSAPGIERRAVVALLADAGSTDLPTAFWTESNDSFETIREDQLRW
ncbi:MAG: hypothetical protein U0556_04915 [Dehalococcoidia bacterium]